jgi:hypothetical protein
MEQDRTTLTPPDTDDKGPVEVPAPNPVQEDVAQDPMKGGSQAVLPPKTRILINRAGSGIFWAHATQIQEVRIPGQDVMSAVSKPLSIAIKFEPSPVEGSLEVVGGSSALVTETMARKAGITFEELCDQVKASGKYGLDFAFLDDKPAADRVLERMRVQADMYARRLREAQVEGIRSSDLVVEND